MKLILTTLVFTLLSGCMTKPSQPDLTKMEKDIIREIMLKTCADTVFRELYPNSKNVTLKSGAHKYYSLTIHVPCEVLKKKDSLKIQASSIANNLKSNLLTKDFKYSFNHSWDKVYIDFVCSPTKGYEESESFEFDN